MPGIVGFTRERAGSDPSRWLEVLEAMQTSITHRPFYQQSEPVSDDGAFGAASLVFPADDAAASNTYHDEAFDVWLHGELLDDDSNDWHIRLTRTTTSGSSAGSTGSSPRSCTTNRPASST